MRNKLKQVHIHGQWMLPSLMHSFVGQSSIRELCPPALVLGLERERTEEEKKREVLHLFRCYTHTPGRSRVNPERQKEERRRTQTTGKGQNSAGGGGEQTDLQNQPTRRNGPDQNSAHT